MVTALTGTEVLQVLAVQANGQPAATTEQVTTQQIANLGGSSSNLLVVTALNTVGAGTITAAGIANKVTARGGAQSSTPFTDTTDTAANIIAALSAGTAIGAAFKYTYQNNTNANATITGGTGVTVSGLTVVPPASWVEYVVTYTAANTITMVAIESGIQSIIPSAQFTTAADATTFAAGALTGAEWVNHTNTANTPGTVTTRTATLMFGDIPNAVVGQTYMLRIRHNGTGTLTVGAGVGVTITGTATIATLTSRDYMVTLNSATTLTLQDMGSGAA